MTEVSGAKSPKKNKSSTIVSGLHLQETSSPITPERLDGTNYVECSLNARNKIRGRKRWGYISGTKAAPSNKKSEEYEEWEDENCLVKSWLLDAMTKDIRSLFLRLSTAKEIWEKIWQELDDIDACIMECANDIAIYTTKVNSERVYKFLAGLDPHLDGVQGRVLSTNPLLDIQAAYAMVCSEANCQDAMLGENIGEGTVMASRKMTISKKDKKCTHCNGTGHMVDTCFRLHGYPEWHPKVYVHLHPRQRTKLESHALKCVFVGYGNNKKGYKCFDPKTLRLYVSMDITFHKTELFYRTPTPNLPFQGENSDEVINYEELEAFFTSKNISSSGDSLGHGEFLDESEELSVVELETSHTEDNALHDSAMPPNNSTQPLSQSSSEIPPEVSTNPNSTCSDDFFF
ncbi:hypothetical protein RHGRI_031284 [Rhododendron griersonianum]|uniref:Uncharacterized protein n=1 Tax=Rhododendron griersonianum TaxID=479676 RepID=A0AAV6IBZ9_9ERIC|nr:hypothetical protein RHGRI_031284 [Rhododendron griersonianum]